MGAILQRESACVYGADGLLSVESWGVGAESFPCARGGPFFISYFTSLPPLNPGYCGDLFCLVLFYVSRCISFCKPFLIQNSLGLFFSTMYILVLVESCL